MRISVVIPCHNAAPYLAQTIGAVLDQTRPAGEIIVVEDSSTDGSLAVAEAFEERLPTLIQVTAVAFRSAARTRNLGARLATGDAIMFLDADDVLRADALDALAAGLGRDRAGIAVCPWFRLGWVDGRWISQPPSCSPRSAGQDALSAWLTGWYHPPCSVLWSRSAFERAGRWGEGAGPNDDGDIMMRALAYGVPLLETADGAAYYRRAPANRRSLSGTRMTSEGLAGRLRTIRKIAMLLEHQGCVAPYGPPLSAAFRRIGEDAREVPAIRKEVLALSRRYAPSIRARLTGRGCSRPAVVLTGWPPPAPGEEIRAGLDRAEQVLTSPSTGRRGSGHARGVPHQPSVSVLIPTYNRAELLLRAIKSVVAQTFQDIEVLIIDDGSTDGTAETVEAIRDARVRYLRQPQNGGVAAARNRGLREAQGEFVAFLDSDDEWLPGKLERQVGALRQAPPDVALVYTGVETVLADGSRQVALARQRGHLYRAMLEQNVIHGGGSNVMIRRDVVATVGFFHEGMPAIEDYEYWLRITRFYRVEAVADPLIRYYDAQADPARRSRAVQANLEARWWLYRTSAAEMRRAGMAHLFLLKTARWLLKQPGADLRDVRRLAARAVMEKPYSRPALRTLATTLRLRRPKLVRVLLYSSVQPAHRGGVQAVIGRVAEHLRHRGVRVVKAWSTPSPDPGDVTYRPPHLAWKGRLPTLRSLAGAARDLLRLTSGLARQRPHVVNVHFLTRDAFWLLLLRPVFRYKVVLSVHGSDVLRIAPHNTAMVPRMCRWADAVTAVSESTRTCVAALAGVDPARVRLIANGVDHAFWSSPVRDGAERPPVVLAVGRLHPVKGHDLLLHAFPEILAGVPGARLVIIGEGGFRADLLRIVDTLGLGAVVELTGELAPAAVRDRMRGAGVFALPSRSEGLPLTLLEAMAAGLPVVATAVGGVPDVLESDSGVLVPPENPDALAAALKQVLLDPLSASRMAALASARAARFSAEAADAKYACVFEEVLAPAAWDAACGSKPRQRGRKSPAPTVISLTVPDKGIPAPQPFLVDEP